jgi:hypothetical protein
VRSYLCLRQRLLFDDILKMDWGKGLEETLAKRFVVVVPWSREQLLFDGTKVGEMTGD